MPPLGGRFRSAVSGRSGPSCYGAGHPTGPNKHDRGGPSWTEPEILIEPFAGGAVVSLTAVMEDLVATAFMAEIDYPHAPASPRGRVR